MAAPLLTWLDERDDVRLLGPADDSGGHRCPTIAFVPEHHDPLAVATALAEREIAVGAGHSYAWRTLEAMGVDPHRGVVRASLVHYTSADDVRCLVDGLDAVLSR